MTRRCFISCFIMFCGAVVADGQSPAAGTSAEVNAFDRDVEVVVVDGRKFTGRLVSISKSEAVFKSAGRLRKLPLRDLWRIRVAPKKQDELMNRPGRKVLVLTSGGILGVEKISLSDDKISLESEMIGKATVDMSSVATIYFPKRSQQAAGLKKRCAKMNIRGDKQDYLIAEDGKGNWIPVPGVLKSIGPRKVKFRFNQTDRTVSPEFVRVIRLARIPGKSTEPRGRIVGVDGSVLPFTSIKFSASKLSVSTDDLKDAEVNLSVVAEVRFRSDRFAYLSDLKPVKVVQSGLFDLVFPYRRDRSSAGRPMRMGKVTYAKGIGMHSRCELTYDLGGKFITFAAIAGIDQAGGNRGNATLKILGDGKDLIKPLNLSGGKEALPVRCDVTGVKQLTILVDFGADGIDVGDHVDLAEARLIKK